MYYDNTNNNNNNNNNNNDNDNDYLNHHPISSVMYNICDKIDIDQLLNSSAGNSMNTNGSFSSSIF